MHSFNLLIHNNPQIRDCLDAQIYFEPAESLKSLGTVVKPNVRNKMNHKLLPSCHNLIPF